MESSLIPEKKCCRLRMRSEKELPRREFKIEWTHLPGMVEGQSCPGAREWLDSLWDSSAFENVLVWNKEKFS